MVAYYITRTPLWERKPQPRLVWEACGSQFRGETASPLVFISWKFHKYPFTRYPVMLLLTNADPWNTKLNPVSNVQKQHPRNVPGFFLCHRRPVLKIQRRSILLILPRRCLQTCRLTLMGDRETIWSTIKRSSELFLLSCLTCHENFIKTHSPFFHNIVNKHGSIESKNRPWIQCNWFLVTSLLTRVKQMD